MTVLSGLLLFPFTRELLGFRNLSGSHLGSYEVAPFYCAVTVFFFGGGCHSKVVPFVGLYIVLRDTFSTGVHAAEDGLRPGMPLSGGELKPFRGFGIVLRDTSSFSVQVAEVVLRLGLPLSSGEA